VAIHTQTPIRLGKNNKGRTKEKEKKGSHSCRPKKPPAPHLIYRHRKNGKNNNNNNREPGAVPVKKQTQLFSVIQKI
jgi:hypothetical protein